MRILYFLVFIFVTGCSHEKREATINREIKLKEARRGRELVKLSINNEKIIADTTAIYYQADVRIKSTDSTIIDSIFLIKGEDGVLLPFSTKTP